MNSEQRRVAEVSRRLADYLLFGHGSYAVAAHASSDLTFLLALLVRKDAEIARLSTEPADPEPVPPTDAGWVSTEVLEEGI